MGEGKDAVETTKAIPAPPRDQAKQYLGVGVTIESLPCGLELAP
jgi:hypothetical protein